MKKCLASGHHNGILRVFQQWKETALSWSLRNNFSLKVQPLRPNLPSETLPTPSLCPNQTEQSELKVQSNVTSLACSSEFGCPPMAVLQRGKQRQERRACACGSGAASGSCSVDQALALASHAASAACHVSTVSRMMLQGSRFN